MFLRTAAFVFILTLGIGLPAWACDICASQRYSQDIGSVSTAGGTTLGKGVFSSGFTFEHRKWDEQGHRNAHELHEEGRDIHNLDHDELYHFSLGYGLTNDLEVGLTMSLVDKSFLRVEDGVVGNGDSSFGRGDLSLDGKYRFHKGEVDLALLAGIKFPTGDTSDRGFDGKKLEPEEVAGTGSFDYLLGLAASNQMGRWTVGVDVIYNFKTEGAQKREFGDVLRADLVASYAVREPGLFPNVRLTGELNAQVLGQDEGRSGRILDSGGEVLFLSPGFSVDLNPQTAVFFSVPVPVHQNRGGEHQEVKYGLIAGISRQI